MKKRLNGALNSLDERLIQEAAEADRLESNVPKIMRNILIPTGAAAAAGLCVFALANRPDGGVNLNESSASSADLSVTLPVNDSLSAESPVISSLPESIFLNEPTIERVREFGTNPHLLFADNDTAIFTDFSGVVYYADLNVGGITYAADVSKAISNAVGADMFSSIFPQITYTAVETETGRICAALVFETEDNGEITYTIDRNNGMLRRERGSFTQIEQEQPAFSGDTFGGMKMCSNVLKIDENKYIGMTNDINIETENENEKITPQIVVFSLDDSGNKTADLFIQVFECSYINSLSPENPVIPDEIQLIKPSREYAEELVFGSEFPTLLYADENYCTFTDIGRGFYIYDRNQEKITFSANIYESLKNAAGDSFDDFGAVPTDMIGDWHGIFFGTLLDGDGIIPTVGLYYRPGDIYIDYAVDIEKGVMRRLIEKEKELPVFSPDLNPKIPEADNLFAQYYQTGDNRYVGISFYASPTHGYLRMIRLVEFSVENDKINIISEVLPFTDDYFNSLEVQDSTISVYKLGQVAFRFNTADKTFVISTPPSINYVPNGSYEISGGELILTIDEEEYRCAISGDTFDVSVGEKGSIPAEWVWEDDELPENVDKLTFTLSYGDSIFDSLSDARSIIPDILKQYYADKGITDFEYDEAVIKNMSNPIDAAGAEIVCYNGYDEWRGGNHDGIDVTGENINGADISAPLDGTVIAVSNDSIAALGKYVVIDHGNGLATVYAHCGEITVIENQQVSQGEVIAKVGSTGFSTGAHLHFEIRKGWEVDDKAMALFTGKFMMDTIPAEEQ